MQRNSSPQPYPYYYYKQKSCSISSAAQLPFPALASPKHKRTSSPVMYAPVINHPNNNINNNTNNNLTSSISPQAIVIENGRQNGPPGIFFSTNRSGTSDRLEKIPLVQKWSPTGGHQTKKIVVGSNIGVSTSTRHMNKSMSLDTPVSIAHV